MNLKDLHRGALAWVEPSALYVGLDGLMWLNGLAPAEAQPRKTSDKIAVRRSLHDGRFRINYGAVLRLRPGRGGECAPGFEPLPVAEASVSGAPAEQRRVA